MNIRDFKYLAALANHRHFGKAAQACHVSQPALSIQIKKFEERLGVQLLERTNKSVALTEIGLILAKRAEHILNQVQDFQEIARLANDPYSGEVRLGIIPSVAPYLLPHILQKLATAFPKLKFYLMEWPTAGLIEKLEQREIDAAILPFPIQQKNISAAPFYEEELLLAVPPSHPFSKRHCIKQEELKNEKLLLLDDGHCMSEPLQHLCRQLNTTELSNFRATSLETLRHMVTMGLGITLMPKLAYKSEDNFSYIPLHKTTPTRLIGMAWRSTSSKSLLMHALLDQAKQILAASHLVKIA